MSNKPEVILQLEKAWGFPLEQVELEEIGKWDTGRRAEFALNAVGEVLGLRLKQCEIEDLSPLQGLTALTQLNLSSNQFTDLSPLQGLTALTALDLSINQLTDLSPLQGLTALTQLNLWKNQLTDLSPLQGLTALTELNLYDNQFTDLSPLQDLTALTELDLSINQLTDLSPLQGLTALTQLNLWKNQLTDLSPLQGLTALTELDLSENQLTDLSPLQGLTALTELDLRWTQLTDISPLQGLTALTKLDLRDNQLTDLSPLQGLTALIDLNLQNNQIQEITLAFLNHFPNLKELKLYGNPIKNLPADIFNHYYTNVLTPVRHFLEDLEKQAVQAYQAKVILIGNGRVGKTCLLKRWLDKTFDAHEPSTHAIQLRQYPLKPLAKQKRFKNIQLSIWDFGGQDIYHATHRLFMQTQAIFVLVWDAKTEQTSEQTDGQYSYRNYPLSYWLEYAKNLGNNNPVLIVQTKKQRDEEQIPNDLTELRKKYTIIAAIAVDSSQEKHNGFTVFETHLLEQVEQQLETTCTALPAAWWQVQNQVQTWQARKKTLSLNNFNQLCQKFGLDAQHASSVLFYLHHSGVVFYREHLFQNQLILDQKWAIDAVYTLFDRQGMFPRLVKNGEFSTADLQPVWHSFNEAEQTVFLVFMKSCEICFEVDYKWDKPFIERRFIAPALLPDTKPAALTDVWEHIEKKYRVRYDYRFLHYGNLQSFIVRTHEWSEPTSLWKHGCQLKDEQNNLALIEGFFNVEKPYLQLTIAGQNPQSLLDKVRNEFDKIQKDDTVDELWSLNGADFVRKTHVENAPKQNRQIQTINGVWVNVEDFKSFIQKNHKDRFMSEINIFVSYASPDRELRELLVEGLTRHLTQRADFTYKFWTDKDIMLGDEWQAAIDHSLQTTQAALLLVSASFAASGFINAKELPVFFQRKKQEGYRIMPVLVRDFSFAHFEEVSTLQFFKPYHGDYGFNKPAEKTKIMPFDKIAEDTGITDGIRERYYKNLADEIDKMVRAKFKS